MARASVTWLGFVGVLALVAAAPASADERAPWVCSTESAAPGGLPEETTHCELTERPEVRLQVRRYQVHAARSADADATIEVYADVYKKTLRGADIADPEPIERHGWSGRLLRWAGKRGDVRLRGVDRVYVHGDQVVRVAVEAPAEMWSDVEATIEAWRAGLEWDGPPPPDE